jgi:hypothetical protein
MLNKRKVIKGVLVEIGFVSVFIIALIGLSWLI